MAMPHFMHNFYDPIMLWTEFAYTLVIVSLCFLVYYKTREIYSLTKYKGIQFFRNAFMFFGLAYSLRMFLHLLLIGRIAFDFILPQRTISSLSMVFVGYFSTMAILYLTYSTIWKRIKIDHFLIFSNLLALSISLISFIYRSHHIMFLLQSSLLIFAVIMSFIIYKKNKKLSHIKIFYFLLLVFWLLDLFVLGPRRMLPFEIKIIMQVVSILIFSLISYKVFKWTK